MAGETPSQTGGFSPRKLLRAIVNAGEPAIEFIIRVCGWSAILFVLAIFLFVFIEAAPGQIGRAHV